MKYVRSLHSKISSFGSSLVGSLWIGILATKVEAQASSDDGDKDAGSKLPVAGFSLGLLIVEWRILVEMKRERATRDLISIEKKALAPVSSCLGLLAVIQGALIAIAAGEMVSDSSEWGEQNIQNIVLNGMTGVIGAICINFMIQRIWNGYIAYQNFKMLHNAREGGSVGISTSHEELAKKVITLTKWTITGLLLAGVESIGIGLGTNIDPHYKAINTVASVAVVLGGSALWARCRLTKSPDIGQDYVAQESHVLLLQ